MIREYIIKISDEIMEEEIADRPQELVRCKHCKHFDGLNCKVNDITNIMDTNWFCADGESKTACDGCENKGSEDCALGKPGSENAYCPNGKLR